MQIINHRLNLEEFKTYVRQYNFGPSPANKLVIHHTWRPTASTWRGQRTIYGLKRYYEGKGWSSGPHLFIAEDGIWLFSPMNRDGIHAGPLNRRSIGIEVVGDYNRELWSGNTKLHALGAIRILMDRLKLTEKDIYFHRDVSPKTCPGKMISKGWLFREMKKDFKN
jgi:N-acetylmuramoyl-L-alanine amidase CwlA